MLSVAAIDATEPLVLKSLFDELTAAQRGQMFMLGLAAPPQSGGSMDMDIDDPR
jgi:hypothetical protein